MEEVNVKNLGYNLRYGYTDGFNAGLTASGNEFRIPEEQWNSPEKLDPGKYLRYPYENDAMPEYEYASEKKEHYRVGYNWGYMHGGQVREDLRNSMPEGIFDESMEDFANALEISYLQVGKERYLHGITSLEPEAEKGYRLKFINEFLSAQEGEKPERADLDAIRERIAEKKIQQAIDGSIIYYRALKNLSAYSQARTFQSRLMKIRRASQEKKVPGEEYQDEKNRILTDLTRLIEKENS